MTAQAIAERQDHAPVAANETASVLSLIERMATDPKIDLDRVERVIAMRDRMVAEAARQAFHAAFTAAQAEMPQVTRDAINDQTKSRYAKYETISDAIQPIITKHGFGITFGEAKAEQPNHMRITATLMHSAGHAKDYWTEIPIDMYGMKGNANKTATHAHGSTKSYGRRYLKVDIFDIAVKSEDNDGNTIDAQAPELQPVSEEQVAELLALIERGKSTAEKFCQVTHVASVADLPSAHFDAAKKMLLERIAKVEGNSDTASAKASLDKQFGDGK